MTSDSRAVLIDTDVFSRVFVAPKAHGANSHVAIEYRKVISGWSVVVSFQTRAEALIGARSARWGDRRTTDLRNLLDSTPTVGLDTEVLERYVTLTDECQKAGHALHAKIHTADRWIAACAIAKRLPLFSGDGIYQDAPGLELFDPPG